MIKDPGKLSDLVDIAFEGSLSLTSGELRSLEKIDALLKNDEEVPKWLVQRLQGILRAVKKSRNSY